MNTDKQLDEPSRQRLDGIVQKMEANAEPEQNIRAVVADFKDKYGQAPAPMTGVQKTGEVAKGFAKGLLSSILPTGAAHNVGPLGEMKKNLYEKSPVYRGSFEATDKALESKNVFQTGGKVLEAGGEMAVGGGIFKGIMNARKAANAGSQALEIASPKVTQKVAREALEQGRGQKSGLLGKVTIAPDKQTIKAANSIEDLTRQGKLGKSAAEDSKVVFDEIGHTADELVTRLQKMEVRPIVQHGELKGIFKGVSDEIAENPYLDEAASKQAQKMFDLFIKKLPKGQDIDASDLLKARKEFDAAVRSMKPNAFDPKSENGTSMALRAIRHRVNDLIAAKAPDQGVKESLARQSALYDALENIAAKGAKEVGTTAFGRFGAKYPHVKHAIEYAVPGGLLGGWAVSKMSGE